LTWALKKQKYQAVKTFRKVVREEIDVDLHCTSAKFRRRGKRHLTFANELPTEG